MKMNAIMATTEDDVIGIDGGLPWGRQRADMQRFKTATMGRVVIMGRKTWESLPGPLSGRMHIVVTRSNWLSFEGAMTANSLEEAIAKAHELSATTPFLIGGGELYREALEKDLIEEFWLTRVMMNVGDDVIASLEHQDKEVVKVDLAKIDSKLGWVLKSSQSHGRDEHNEYPMIFTVFKRGGESSKAESSQAAMCPDCGSNPHLETCPTLFVEQQRKIYETDLKAHQAVMAEKFNKSLFKPCVDCNPNGSGRQYTNQSLTWLKERVLKELDELQEALDNGDLEEALRECADAGNFLVMLSGNIRRMQ